MVMIFKIKKKDDDIYLVVQQELPRPSVQRVPPPPLPHLHPAAGAGRPRPARREAGHLPLQGTAVRRLAADQGTWYY